MVVSVFLTLSLNLLLYLIDSVFSPFLSLTLIDSVVVSVVLYVHLSCGYHLREEGSYSGIE